MIIIIVSEIRSDDERKRELSLKKRKVINYGQHIYYP